VLFSAPGSDAFGFDSSTIVRVPSIEVTDVSVLSVSQAWAVGGPVVQKQWRRPLIWQWNGQRWSTVDNPDVGPNSGFESVEAISSADVWAGGFYHCNIQCLVLLEHWDGTTWSVVFGPGSQHPAAAGKVSSISATATDDVWAQTGPTSMEHWNGRRWRSVPTDPDSTLFAVAAESSDDAWAVGFPGFEHWGGTAWTITGSTAGTLTDVAGSSSTDLWAIGYAPDGSALSEHWDGQSWTVVPLADQHPRDPFQWAITSIAPTDAWAVGGANFEGRQRDPVVEHWDGTQWTQVVLPAGAKGAIVQGVDAASSDDVWIVGSKPRHHRPYFAHWNGHRWRHHFS
jgi:hypothetical protein